MALASAPPVPLRFHLAPDQAHKGSESRVFRAFPRDGGPEPGGRIDFGTSVEHYANSSFPTKKVYGNIEHAGLRLITCGGLDAKTSEFEENVVVFADLVSS